MALQAQSSILGGRRPLEVYSFLTVKELKILLYGSTTASIDHDYFLSPRMHFQLSAFHQRGNSPYHHQGTATDWQLIAHSIASL